MKRRVPSYIQALFKLGPKILTEKKKEEDPNLEDKSRPQLNCLNWWVHYRQKLTVNNPLSGWPVFLRKIGVSEKFWTTISHQPFSVWLIVKIFFLKKINFRKINTRKTFLKQRFWTWGFNYMHRRSKKSIPWHPPKNGCLNFIHYLFVCHNYHVFFCND